MVAKEACLATPLDRVFAHGRALANPPDDLTGSASGDVDDPCDAVIVIALTSEVPDAVFFGNGDTRTVPCHRS